MDAIRLSLSDAYGEATALTAKHYVTIDPNPMGERRSFDRVILQPGEDHFFPIDFGYYKDEIGLPIAPGQYTLQAAYIEPPAPSDKLVANDPRRSCWTGSITAPPLPITIPEDSTQ